jgi:hypothetical protein
MLRTLGVRSREKAIGELVQRACTHRLLLSAYVERSPSTGFNG